MKEDGSKRNLANSLGVSYFVHPLPLLAVGVLVLNDHYLKRAYPSWITGKLSDFAGLFFFPIFLCALWNLFANLLFKPGRMHWITLRQAVVAVILTDIVFVSVKLLPPATDIYLAALAFLGYPSVVTLDPTDLFALLVSPFTLWYAKRQAQVA